MGALPLHHSGNGEEVEKLDFLFTFIATVGANVLSYFIVKKLDKLFDDNNNNKR